MWYYDLITATSGGGSELEPNMVSLFERARSLAKLRPLSCIVGAMQRPNSVFWGIFNRMKAH